MDFLHCTVILIFFLFFFLNASVNAKHVFLQLSVHFLYCIWFLDTFGSLVRTKSLLCCAKHSLNHTKFAHIHSPFILLVDVCWTAAGSSKDFFCVQNHIFWLITITDFWTTTYSTSSSCYVIQFNTMQTNATPIQDSSDGLCSFLLQIALSLVTCNWLNNLWTILIADTMHMVWCH